jgi:hypothetical protein
VDLSTAPTSSEGDSDYDPDIDDIAYVICGDTDHGDKMLMCDEKGCNMGYDLGCLDPPLHCVPALHWYCPPCNSRRMLSRAEADADAPSGTEDSSDNDLSGKEAKQADILMDTPVLEYLHNRVINPDPALTARENVNRQRRIINRARKFSFIK